MNNAPIPDKSAVPKQGTDEKAAKEAYYAKQAKDVKASVAELPGQLERARMMEEMRHQREAGSKPAPESESQGQGYDHHNGMSP